MSILIWAIIGLLTLTTATWLVYNFWWLGRPQTYLVWKASGEHLFSQTNLNLLQKATGGKWATFDQLNKANQAGLNVCTAGWVDHSHGKGIPTKGWYPTWVEDAGDHKCPHSTCSCKDGCVCGCGCNKQLNSIDGASVFGYWLYGSKPASLPEDLKKDGWKIAPWSAKRKGLGVDKNNKYEYFGIPKVL